MAILRRPAILRSTARGVRLRWPYSGDRTNALRDIVTTLFIATTRGFHHALSPTSFLLANNELTCEFCIYTSPSFTLDVGGHWASDKCSAGIVALSENELRHRSGFHYLHVLTYFTTMSVQCKNINIKSYKNQANVRWRVSPPHVGGQPEANQLKPEISRFSRESLLSDLK